MFGTRSALILKVMHDEERQLRDPRPVMEEAPYSFVCTRRQLVDLTRSIQRVLDPQPRR